MIRSAPSHLAPATNEIPTIGWRHVSPVGLHFRGDRLPPQPLRQTSLKMDSTSDQACPIPSPQPHLRHNRLHLEISLGRPAHRLKGYYAGLPNTRWAAGGYK